MHVVALVYIRPTIYHEYSHLQLVLGKQPNASHNLYQLHLHNSLKYAPNKNLGFM